MVEPYVRDFADPLEGLRWQLEELQGFARVVPPLIDAHWQKVWDEAMSGPGDPEEDPTDAYARAAGPGTGGGFADFGRTVLMASITLGWQAFVDYLALRLAQLEDPRRYRGSSSIRDEIAMNLTRLPLPGLVQRFSAAGVDLPGLDGWSEIREIQFTRNALVHNHGRYTPEYFEKVETPRMPEDLYAKYGTQRVWHTVLVSHSGGQMSYVSHPGTWLSRLTEGGVCRLAYREALDLAHGDRAVRARFKASRVTC